MTDTVFVRGTGGAIFQMDVPTNVHARERWDASIEKGDLVVLPADEIVERVEQGATFFDHVSTGARADDATRVELLEQAKALGLKVTERTSAKRLAAAIAAAEADSPAAPTDRAALEARAFELFSGDELEAIDVMSDDDLAAAIAVAEAEVADQV